MPFKDLLTALVEKIPGAQGAIIADWEGEAVAQVGLMDDYDLKLIGAHKGVILHNLREVIDRLGEDELKEIVITTGKAQMLIRPEDVGVLLSGLFMDFEKYLQPIAAFLIDAGVPAQHGLMAALGLVYLGLTLLSLLIVIVVLRKNLRSRQGKEAPPAEEPVAE
ncbi:MAG: roadblock/LC7 domain-containing protein [Desulfuromonadales bacterium]